jgi:hypothetical protein
MKKIEYFLIYCSTGCSCCNGENHYRGPFSTKEIAQARVPQYREQQILASQYSSRGNYSVEGPYEGEQLEDGRIIGDETVYQGFADDKTVGGEEEKCRD